MSAMAIAIAAIAMSMSMSMSSGGHVQAGQGADPRRLARAADRDGDGIGIGRRGQRWRRHAALVRPLQHRPRTPRAGAPSLLAARCALAGAAVLKPPARG